MSDEQSQATTKNKRYYWLKLQEYFFNQDEFLQLEDNYDAILGQCCAYFYIKLCSCATENGVISKVVGSKIIPYNEKSLSKLTNTPIKVIKFSLEVLLELGLIKYDNHGAMILPHINEMVGSETESTRRSRKSRMLQCNDDATLVQHQRNHILDKEEDKEKKQDINTDKNLDRNHVFFSGLDDKTIDALIQWIDYQQKYGKTPQQIMNPVSRKMLDTQVEAGNDIAFSINYTMSVDAKNLIYKPDPVVEAKNKNLSPEERKKLKEVQLKKEDRHNILSNYCKGVTYEEAYLTLNKKRKGEIEHYPLRVAEVITKSECDKYMIKYPTRGEWELLNTEREGFLLTNGGFENE
jgi:predicted phage replisome organizer